MGKQCLPIRAGDAAAYEYALGCFKMLQTIWRMAKNNGEIDRAFSRAVDLDVKGPFRLLLYGYHLAGMGQGAGLESQQAGARANIPHGIPGIDAQQFQGRATHRPFAAAAAKQTVIIDARGRDSGFWRGD